MQHRINHLEVIERLFHLFLCSEWNLRPTLDVPQRQNFIWIAPFIPAEVEGQLKVLCSATWPHKMPNFDISTLIKQHTYEIHLPSADKLIFFFKMKWNLAALPRQDLKISQVLTSSLLTSPRHNYGSLLPLFGRHCSGRWVHLVIRGANTSTADAVNQGWRFRYGLCPSAPVTAHALRQQVLWWKMAHFT